MSCPVMAASPERQWDRPPSVPAGRCPQVCSSAVWSGKITSFGVQGSLTSVLSTGLTSVSATAISVQKSSDMFTLYEMEVHDDAPGIAIEPFTCTRPESAFCAISGFLSLLPG